jgi:phage baseplate assembly protein W
MGAFEIIHFGAISYREIFQNVKTILATPIMSAALERTLGVDQNIVDQPMNVVENIVVAVNTALFFWEPRVEVISCTFVPDFLSGHLLCNLQLKVKNVLFGTDQQYNQANFFPEPMKVQQGLPPMQEPVLIPGPKGDPGTRGSQWFTGSVDPDMSAGAVINYLPGDMYLNTTTGDVFQFSSDSSGTLVATRKTL